MSAPFVLAVPSKGRLQENAEAFFARAGLKLVKPRGAREYRGAIAGVPGVEIAYLSASDITAQLAQGGVHFGVTGEDQIRETIPDAEQRVVLIDRLGFGEANVVVAVPQAWIDVRTMADLDDVATAFRAAHDRKMRVATKFVNLTRQFFSQHGIIDYRIVESLGATEGAPAAGTAELIVDITTTGATLARNGLKVLDDGTMLRSEANLIAARGAVWGAEEREIARLILDRIAAQGARAPIPRGAHALARRERQGAGGGEGALRCRGTLRRAYLVGHADPALPARACARACELPARQGRRERDGRGYRLRVHAGQSALCAAGEGAGVGGVPAS